MGLQKQSWVMTRWVVLKDRIFHYQKDGKTICGLGVTYALFEEVAPPKRDRCKDCVEKLR